MNSHLGLWPRTLAVAVALALLTACSSGGSSASSNVVKIGVDLPLSGADASVGQSTLNGIILAVESANEGHALPDGMSVAVDSLDDAVQGVHSPQQGVANVRTFVSDANVLAVVGPYNSNVAAAEIPVTNAAGLAQIGPSVVSDGLTLGADAAALRRSNPDLNTFFRVCTTDTRQGAAGARFAHQLGWKTAYLVDDNETYGLDLADVFESDFGKLGGKVLGHDHLAANTQDFKALLLKIAASKPDVLFYGGVTSTGGGLLRKQMFDTGLGKTPMLGGDGIPDLNTVAGNLADGAYYTVAAPNAEKLPVAQGFVKAYQVRFNAPVGPYSANAYAATQVAIAAIAAAARNAKGFPARAAVVKQVVLSDLQTPIGHVQFDRNGDIRNPVISLYTFKNGQPSFIQQLNLTDK
ncbi:MAG TPA: branched-chain amino acid ABC transporter substrate-binding protein [Verrucomicrobiae bacterium]|jgi:branched-chain amino acid transport system substrate-binding protein|nr:branched-chain amino acid ABC transporter substrate-binding protein [Verrucomicrobiae bacterium]